MRICSEHLTEASRCIHLFKKYLVQKPGICLAFCFFHYLELDIRMLELLEGRNIIRTNFKPNIVHVILVGIIPGLQNSLVA